MSKFVQPFVILAAPPLFVLHEMEEYLTVLPWIAGHEPIPEFVRSLVPDSAAPFAVGGVLFLILFTVAGALALRSRPHSVAWVVLAVLIVARLENALLHIIISIFRMQYTPGVLTAVLLVLPLSLYLIRNFLRLDLVRSTWLPAIIIGSFIVQSAAIGTILLLAA